MIKNLIFDFGDVFLNLDKPATAQKMVAHGFQGLTPDLEQLFHHYEKGMCSTADFLKTLAPIFPSATEEYLMEAWNAILLDFPEERLLFLENLAQQKEYRLFLLSNTNDLHIQFVKEYMGQERYERFKNCFEQFYLSYEIGFRKPDAAIYQYVLEQNNLKPEESFFVDDTLENVTTAAHMGIHTWHLQMGREDIVQLHQKLKHAATGA